MSEPQTSFDALPIELRNRWINTFFKQLPEHAQVPITQVRTMLKLYDEALAIAENSKIVDKAIRDAGKGTLLIGAEKIRRIAQSLQAQLPGLSFTLLVTEFGKNGTMNYISNTDRGDMIKAMEELVERLKRGIIVNTPEEN